MSRVPVNVVVCHLMMYSNMVIVGITISRGSFVYCQSLVNVYASLTNVGSLQSEHLISQTAPCLLFGSSLSLALVVCL